MRRTEYQRQYYQNHIEEYRQRSRDFYERKKQGLTKTDFYETREELQEAEARGEGKINWDVFDKTVEEGRKRIEDYLNQCKKKYGGKTTPIPRYVFDGTSGRMLFKDTDVNIAAELAMQPNLVRQYCNGQKYVQYRDLLFSNEWLPTYRVKAIKNQSI